MESVFNGALGSDVVTVVSGFCMTILSGLKRIAAVRPAQEVKTKTRK
jgi:hypothetical protein